MTPPVAEQRRRALVLYSSATAVCGVGTWIDALIREIAPRGWEVSVGLAWGESFHDPRRIEQVRPQWRTIPLDGRTGTEEGRIQAIQRAVQRCRPDVVIVTCLHSAFEALRRLKARGATFRVLATNHGNLAEQGACLLENADTCEAVVCVSRLSALVLRGTGGVDTSRVHHLSHCVPAPRATPVEPRPVRYRVGYAGRVVDEKRGGDLVPFFRNLLELEPRAELWVAGSGARLKDVETFASQHPGKVRCHGQLSRGELYTSFYPELDALVHFSEAEGWGFSLAEAMAHGVVPISSEFFGVHADRLVQDDFTGLLFPIGDTRRAAKRLAELWNDEPRFTRLRHSAADWIATHASTERFGEEWSALLNELCQMPPLSPRSAGGERLWPCWKERLRRLLRRHLPHQGAGQEWPHYQATDRELVSRLERMLKSAARKSDDVACEVPLLSTATAVAKGTA